MRTELALSITGLVLSGISLMVSAFLAVRQVRTQRAANFTPVLTNLLHAFQTPEFHRHYRYVCCQLKIDNDPSKGVSGLSDLARESFVHVVYLYQQFAMLTQLGILDGHQVARVAGPRMREIWKAIEPFALVERERGIEGVGSFHFLEDFVLQYVE